MPTSPVWIFRHHPQRRRARGTSTLLAGVLAASAAAVVAGCGDTLQDQPVPSNVLEQLVSVREYPIYWLGVKFHRLAVTGVLRDPSESFTLQYGDCIEGGQNTCVFPLVIVSSPDNSFSPMGSAPSSSRLIRAVHGLIARGGRTIEIPTGGVVVDIYAENPALAEAAAKTMVAINQGGAPEAPLPAPLPDTGFGSQPVAGQLPHPGPLSGG